LLYRLAQVPLAVPPLSARTADIPGLARFFAGKLGSAEPTADALEYLSRREYTGNVRELKNVIERAVALSAGASMDAALFGSLDAMGWSPAIRTAAGAAYPLDEPMPLKEAKRRMELAYIERQLALSGGSTAKAAERLAVLPNNLSRRLGELRNPPSS
jgi:DNA-binding NtrC family response regulator